MALWGKFKIMIREQVKIQDYERIAKDNEYFIWNFITKDDYPFEIFSFFEENSYVHPLKEVLKYINIPYFESYIDNDSVDFLINLEMSPHQLWRKDSEGKSIFHPLFVGFNKRRKVNSSYDENSCYCKEGLINLIFELNPNFILNAKLD
jgi:hypothetical protein